ncbi:hypothetical protein GKA01_13950 [Gluconobacter kanchanaburiensis NBRC 103587]|uniref:Uncharacterized protein n=1 Tax=Gluconobacter kanchanaburiensis NBRC 103587 TaxID=1307948 RepID=A0A511B727_9PROT|nr:hypothetical protein GKA01_13950 [Gluconobacter kanchanaburiensis NBRC 103587]
MLGSALGMAVVRIGPSENILETGSFPKKIKAFCEIALCHGVRPVWGAAPWNMPEILSDKCVQNLISHEDRYRHKHDQDEKTRPFLK